ncbi:MAG: hypothetical protein WC538_22060 [Thermoanaerobaculia bacterium]|jgi:hypothetical protein
MRTAATPDYIKVTVILGPDDLNSLDQAILTSRAETRGGYVSRSALICAAVRGADLTKLAKNAAKDALAAKDSDAHVTPVKKVAKKKVAKPAAKKVAKKVAKKKAKPPDSTPDYADGPANI